MQRRLFSAPRKLILAGANYNMDFAATYRTTLYDLCSSLKELHIPTIPVTIAAIGWLMSPTVMESIPSRVYEALMPDAGDVIMYKDESEPGLREGAQRMVQQQTYIRPSSSREIQVSGSAEVSCQADRAKVRISISNNKESVNDVSNSISRRVEYILQVLRQHDVKDEDMSVTKRIHREEDLYHMEAEVMVKFSDFEKVEGVCSVLLQKLDKSVCVGIPQFYHSAECLSQLRRNAYASAVENARLKASEVSGLLGQTLGLPLLVREEAAREWRDDEGREGGRAPHRPTLSASSRVFLSFSLRPRKKL